MSTKKIFGTITQPKQTTATLGKGLSKVRRYDMTKTKIEFITLELLGGIEQCRVVKRKKLHRSARYIGTAFDIFGEPCEPLDIYEVITGREAMLYAVRD